MLVRLGKALAVLAVTLAVTAGTAFVVPAPAARTEPAARVADEASYVHRNVLVGRSVRGREIRAFYRGDPAATRVLLVLGQMHGDERAGRDTVRWIWRHLRPAAGTGIWLVPTMNPDGHARRTRKNARGVDLNRNWPTSGWTRTDRGSRYHGGPRPASEPETRAMMRFLASTRPTFIASIHQPLRGIGRSSKGPSFQARLSRNLGLPRKWFGVGNPTGTVSPTLTGWYNARHPGVAITIEYAASPSAYFRNQRAGRGIPRAAGVY